jgi:hypothetical protein
MTLSGNEGLFQWRRFAVDLLTAGATFAVVLTAFGDAANTLGVLLLPGVLLGLSLMVEPDLSRSLRGFRLPPPLRNVGPDSI